MSTILLGAAALAEVALLEGLYYAARFLSERKREDLQRRLQAVSAGGSEQFPTLLRSGRLSSNPFWGELLGGVPLLERMATLLEQAQVGGTVSAQLLFSVLLALAGAAVGLAVRSPAMGVLLFVTGGAMPTVRLLAARARRSRQISEQSPWFLTRTGASSRSFSRRAAISAAC